MEVWGTGKPRREFLHVDDLADALPVAGTLFAEEPINVGCGTDVSIAELAAHIARTVGFEGRFDSTPPSRTARPASCLDVSRLNALGWEPRTPLAVGIAETYRLVCGKPGRRTSITP